jgi:hypothetical protein
MAAIPGAAVPAEGGPHARELMDIVYQQHLLVKRWRWRKGLLSAAGAEGASGAGMLRPPAGTQ